MGACQQPLAQIPLLRLTDAWLSDWNLAFWILLQKDSKLDATRSTSLSETRSPLASTCVDKVFGSMIPQVSSWIPLFCKPVVHLDIPKNMLNTLYRSGGNFASLHYTCQSTSTEWQVYINQLEKNVWSWTYYLCSSTTTQTFIVPENYKNLRLAASSGLTNCLSHHPSITLPWDVLLKPKIPHSQFAHWLLLRLLYTLPKGRENSLFQST